jgi:hypothetical protein
MEAMQHGTLDMQRSNALDLQNSFALVELPQRAVQRVAAGQLEAIRAAGTARSARR